jgi:hypothetical protein
MNQQTSFAELTPKQTIACEIHKIFISTFVEQGEEEAKQQYKLMLQALQIGSSQEEITQLGNIALESASCALPESFVDTIVELWQEIL